MKKTTFFVSALMALLIGCQPSEKSENQEEKMDTEVVKEETPSTFGVTVAEDASLDMPSFLEKMTATDSIGDLTIKGKVKEVCQMKGCWMTIEQPNGETMRVTFKDYALFMPMDIAGKEVVLHGNAKKKVVPVDELKHFAEDAGKPEEEIAAITEPQQKLRFEADGVLIK